MKIAENLTESLLIGRDSFSPAVWENIFLDVFRRRIQTKEVKLLLLLLSRKGEGHPEILGCVQAVRKLEPPRRVRLPFLTDVCGTGGDNLGTFNVSTVSGFVIAAAGGYVAKHGNRSVSSRVGSSDLMEALGIRWDLPAVKMLEALRLYHLGYFHAPFYHPIFANVQDLRRSLSTRTLFNSLGPLLNPLEIRYQTVGISNPLWLGPMAETLSRLPRIRAAVFRSQDGLDELSTGSPSDILYIERGKIKKFTLYPQKYKFSKARPASYEGGDLKANREIALRILSGRMRGPREEIVLLNSGFSLCLLGLVASVSEGVHCARKILRRGIAHDLLQALRHFTKGK